MPLSTALTLKAIGEPFDILGGLERGEDLREKFAQRGNRDALARQDIETKRAQQQQAEQAIRTQQQAIKDAQVKAQKAKRLQQQRKAFQEDLRASIALKRIKKTKDPKERRTLMQRYIGEERERGNIESAKELEDTFSAQADDDKFTSSLNTEIGDREEGVDLGRQIGVDRVPGSGVGRARGPTAASTVAAGNLEARLLEVAVKQEAERRKREEFNFDKGKLSLTNDKRLSQANIDAESNRMESVRLREAANLAKSVKPEFLDDSGVFSNVAEWFKQTFGSEDAESLLRREIRTLLSSAAFRNLPDKHRSKADIKLALRGLPEDSTNPLALEAWLNATANLLDIKAEYDSFVADFISLHRNQIDLDKIWKNKVASGGARTVKPGVASEIQSLFDKQEGKKEASLFSERSDEELIRIRDGAR